MKKEYDKPTVAAETKAMKDVEAEAAEDMREAVEALESVVDALAAPQSSRYFAVVSTPNDGPVNMRDEPSKACAMLKEVPNGEIVLVIGSVANNGATWCKVERNSQKGYIMADFLQRVVE